ncbi:MAG TPA: hypothetical protein VJA23_02465 [Candidatus Nanoarchaeia archaeon]|nr:hypothetical protein [Candidatus Nanoarchaeia archaeon]
MLKYEPKPNCILNGLIYLLILITFVISLYHYNFYLSTEDRPIGSFDLNNGSQEIGYKRTVMGAYAGELGDGSRNDLEKGFYLTHNTKRIPVFFLDGYSFMDSSSLDPATSSYVPPRYGEVAVYGYRTKEAIYALSINNHDYNYIIYVLSFFAGLFVLAFFFREWKITWRGFENA